MDPGATLHGSGAEITNSPTTALSPQSSTPLLANSAIPSHQRFPIAVWSPRSGRNMQYVKWEQDISLLAAAFGIPKAQLAEGVLSFSAYQEMLKQRPGTRSETKAVEAQYVEYKARWQTVNTALYWHVRPSLDIDGVHFLADSRALEDLYSVVVLDDGTFKSLADGRGLIKWARDFVDQSSKEQQKRLRRNIGKAELKAGSTRAQLNLHAERLFQQWKLIDGNDDKTRDGMKDYYEELLATMPTAPEGCHLTNLRMWLAGKLT